MGKNAAIATPICALAAAICRSASEISGRRSSNSEGTCAGIIGGRIAIIFGASEKLAEVYIGPFVGGGIETWFAYAAALAFLLVRPSGLFGQTQVERV